MKALVDIGAARRFTDGMQAAPAKFSFEVVDGLEVSARFAEPFRQTGAGENEFGLIDLDEVVLDHEISLCHAEFLEFVRLDQSIRGEWRFSRIRDAELQRRPLTLNSRRKARTTAKSQFSSARNRIRRAQSELRLYISS